MNLASSKFTLVTKAKLLVKRIIRILLLSTGPSRKSCVSILLHWAERYKWEIWVHSRGHQGGSFRDIVEFYVSTFLTVTFFQSIHSLSNFSIEETFGTQALMWPNIIVLVQQGDNFQWVVCDGCFEDTNAPYQQKPAYVIQLNNTNYVGPSLSLLLAKQSRILRLKNSKAFFIFIVWIDSERLHKNLSRCVKYRLGS